MSLLTAILGYTKRLAAFIESTERNTEDIRELRRQVGEMAVRMEHLHEEFVRLRGEERLEREKLVLQLENTLLRFERRLPAPRTGKDHK